MSALLTLRRFWFVVPIALLAAALFVTRGTLAERTAALAAERAAHASTVANYRAAAETARRLDADNVARVKGDQAKITGEIVHDYEARLADARARAALAGRLRNPAGTGPGAGGAPPVPAARAAAGGADQASGEDRLPAALPLADALIATEQALQLDALIDWVEAQAAVDVTGASPR